MLRSSVLFALCVVCPTSMVPGQQTIHPEGDGKRVMLEELNKALREAGTKKQPKASAGQRVSAEGQTDPVSGSSSDAGASTRSAGGSSVGGLVQRSASPSSAAMNDDFWKSLSRQPSETTGRSGVQWQQRQNGSVSVGRPLAPERYVVWERRPDGSVECHEYTSAGEAQAALRSIDRQGILTGSRPFQQEFNSPEAAQEFMGKVRREAQEAVRRTVEKEEAERRAQQDARRVAAEKEAQRQAQGGAWRRAEPIVVVIPDDTAAQRRATEQAQRLAARRDAARRRCDAALGRYEQVNQTLKRALSAAQSALDAYNSLHFRCPNGEPWSSCTHYDLKQSYNRAKEILSRRLDDDRRYLQQLESAFTSAVSERKRATDELESLTRQTP